jgi:hypothetical protein
MGSAAPPSLVALVKAGCLGVLRDAEDTGVASLLLVESLKKFVQSLGVIDNRIVNDRYPMSSILEKSPSQRFLRMNLLSYGHDDLQSLYSLDLAHRYRACQVGSKYKATRIVGV